MALDREIREEEIAGRVEIIGLFHTMEKDGQQGVVLRGQHPAVVVRGSDRLQRGRAEDKIPLTVEVLGALNLKPEEIASLPRGFHRGDLWVQANHGRQTPA